MAAKRFVHHFIPHKHIADDGAGESHHRGHALENRALFAYLLIFAITVSTFWLVRVKVPQVLGTASYSAAQIIALTNIKRGENGLPPLSENTKLDAAAAGKSADMFTNDYWAHFSPQGKTPWSFITAVGYRYLYAGENLARDFGDAEAVVNAWMASPSHRSNILDKNFKEIGVNVADGKLSGHEGVLVVQMFGAGTGQAQVQIAQAKPVAPSSAASSPSPVQTNSGKAHSTSSGQASPTSSPNQSPPPQSPSPISQPEIADQSNVVAQSALDQESPGLVGGSSAMVLAASKFSISKIVSLLLVGFIFLLFVLEVAVAGKKRDLQIKSSTLAHLGILALTLFAVWYAVAGAVI